MIERPLLVANELWIGPKPRFLRLKTQVAFRAPRQLLITHQFPCESERLMLEVSSVAKYFDIMLIGFSFQPMTLDYLQ